MNADSTEWVTTQTAYQAMYEFLLRFYETYQSDDVGILLSGMSTTRNGQIMDPAYWTEWLECIEKAKQGLVKTGADVET